MTKEIFVTALAKHDFNPRKQFIQKRRTCFWCGVKLPTAKISAEIKEGTSKFWVRFCGRDTKCLENYLKDKNCKIERIL